MKKALAFASIVMLLLILGATAFAQRSEEVAEYKRESLIVTDKSFSLQKDDTETFKFSIPKMVLDHYIRVDFYTETEGPSNNIRVELNGHTIGFCQASTSSWSSTLKDVQDWLIPGQNILKFQSSDSLEKQKVITSKFTKVQFFGYIEQVEKVDREYSRWIPGRAHYHTTFSDGSDSIRRSVEKAKNDGLKFIIFTDHLEQVEDSDRGIVVDTARSVPKTGFGSAEFGIDNYVKQIMSFNVCGEFATSVGVEIMEVRQVDGSSKTSHTLAISMNTDSNLQELSPFKFKKDGQANLLRELATRNYLSIAAHPTLKDYPYDQTEIKYLTGVDFFSVNSINHQANLQKEIDFYLASLKKQGCSVTFVSSCCDYHASKDPFASVKLKRITWIYLKRNEIDHMSTINALMMGRTYAANQGAEITYMNFVPGMNPHKVKEYTLKFSFKFPDKQLHRGVIYRDGDPNPVASKDLNDGSSWDFKDEYCTEGRRHYYILSVPDYLITSPIFLEQ